MSWRRAAGLVVLSCTALWGCGGSGTSLLLEVDVSRVQGIEQLHVLGMSNEKLVFGPAVRPEKANGPLDGIQTLRVLLPEELPEGAVTVRVEGLFNGAVSGAAEKKVDPLRGRELQVELSLEPVPVPCLSCDGCCVEGRCVEGSVSACGAGGVSCFACDPVLADRCSNGGRCACGSGPACAPVQGADRCENGKCRCGGDDPCPAGLQCDNGVCRCTPGSCAGCCSDNVCLPGTSSAACGAQGAQCGVCDTGTQCQLGACL